MIKIDRRAILYPTIPILLLGFIRFMFFLAGAEWNEPQVAAVTSIICGLFSATIIHLAMSENKADWGHWRIGSCETQEPKNQ